MRSRSLAILSLAALVAGVDFWGRFEARLNAATQVPVADRPMFDGFPGMDEPFDWESIGPDLRSEFIFRSTRTLIAAAGRVCTINSSGVTADAHPPYEPSYRGPINMGVTLIGSDAGNDETVVFTGPGGPSTQPMTAFVFGPPHRPLGEFGRIDGQEKAGVSIAVGDYSADTGSEFVFAPGPGVPAALHFVTLGRDDAVQIFPFGETFTGGLNLAIGKLDGRGYDKIVVGQASGGGAVQVYEMDGDTPVLMGQGFPYGPNHTGGVFVTLFDINNDGAADLFVSPGAGPSIVRAFNFKIAENEPPRPTPRLMFNFTPFGENATGGVRVALGVSDGSAVLAATLRDELAMYLLRHPVDGDPTFEQTYLGKPFGANATPIDVKMTPPR